LKKFSINSIKNKQAEQANGNLTTKHKARKETSLEGVKDKNNKVVTKASYSTPRREETPKYTTHKGKIKESYQTLGGLGSNVGDEKWNEVYSRRKAMLKFSNLVNDINKQILNP
jgi:hypothetical protein